MSPGTRPTTPAGAAAWDLAHARRVTVNGDPGVKADLPEFPLSDFLRGFLGRIVDVVGRVPAHALFQFGAHEEARRLAERHQDADLTTTLRLMGRTFGGHAKVMEDTEELVRIEVAECWMLQAPQLEPIVVGLLEGIVSAKKGRRFKAQLARMGNGPTAVGLVDLTPKID